MSERIIMDEAAIQRTVTRMAHEILEYNKGTENLVLLGIKTRGEFLARRIQDKINQIEQKQLQQVQLTLHIFEMILKLLTSKLLKMQ